MCWTVSGDNMMCERGNLHTESIYPNCLLRRSLYLVHTHWHMTSCSNHHLHDRSLQHCSPW